MYVLLLAAAVSGAAAAHAYRPDFDPSKLKGPARGPVNEVMVLGSPHLLQFPETFDPATLRGLEDRLAAWKPDMISIEALSGTQLDHVRRFPARYKDVIRTYCWDTAPAQAATGWMCQPRPPKPKHYWRPGPRILLPASAGVWPPCSLQAANALRPSCSGCASRKRRVAPATAWTTSWCNC